MTNEKAGQLVAVKRMGSMHLANKRFSTRLCKEFVHLTHAKVPRESNSHFFQCPQGLAALKVDTKSSISPYCWQTALE